MNGVRLAAGQALHHQLEQVGPVLWVIPLCNGRNSIGHTGAHLADRLGQPLRQDVSDLGFGLQKKNNLFKFIYLRIHAL